MRTRESVLWFVVAAGTATPVGAAAGAELSSEGGEDVLVERAHSLEVRITGMIAVVTERQEIVAERAGSFEAVYRYALPAGAALTDLSVKLPNGRVAKGMLVTADAAAVNVSDAEALEAKPDVALLRRIEWTEDPDGDGGGAAGYELRVYPVEAKGVEVKTTWIAPLRYDGGRLTFRVPGRGEADNLTKTTVALEITAPSGAGGFHEIAGDGVRLAKNVGASKGTYRFKAKGRGGVVIEAVPWFADDELRASYAAVPLDEGGGALALGLLAPPVKPAALPKYDRALFVVDVSKSMQASGLRAARDVTAAVLEILGKGAQVEAILFDRTARRALGRFAANDREAAREVAQAIADAKLANGSDLGAALDLAAQVLEQAAKQKGAAEEKGGAPRTLLVIVSDGMSPLALDVSQARDRLGDHAAENSFVVSVTLYPEEAVAPDPYGTVAGALAARAGGRAFSIRDLDASTAAKRMAGELTRPAPITDLVLASGTALVEDLELPAEIPPGSGFVTIARYRGALPKELALGGYRAASELSHKLTAAGPELASATLPLWVARAEIDDLVAPDQAGDDGGLRDARLRLLGLADRAGVVTAHSSLVAVDPDDAFARDRLAMVAKWGGSVYQRLPPPPERESGRSIREEPPESSRPLPRTARVPQVRFGTPRVVGDLDKSSIRRPIRDAVLKPVRACYEKAMRPAGTLAGSLDLMLELSARGEVTLAWIEKSTLGSAELERCVLDAAYTIDVPSLAHGEQQITLVRYPLTFRVQNSSVTDEPRILYADPDDPLDGIL